MSRGMSCWKSRAWMMGFAALALAGLVTAGTIVAQTKSPPTAGENGTAQIAQSGHSSEAAIQGTNFAKQLSQAFRGSAARVLPSVVSITNTPPVPQQAEDQESTEGNEDPFKGTPFDQLFRQNPEFRHFFKGGPSGPHGMAQSQGSGVVIDASGVILTNTHVVEHGKPPNVCNG